MPVAFKEWAVTVRALSEGEQLLTLRKGGIREEDKHFELEHEQFFLYPTFDHQRNDLVRESHHPELRRALEEGVWPEDYALKRLKWKRRHPLHVLLLRVYRIPRPVTVRVRDEYHGCRSWVEIDRELPFEGTPVMADEEFARAAASIGVIAGQPEPVPA